MSYDVKTIEEKIAQKLGVSRTTIYIWKHQFGAPKKQKRHTEAEKAEFVKQFYKIETENPQIRYYFPEFLIRARTGFELSSPGSPESGYFWDPVSEREMDIGGPIDNVQRHGGSERSTSSANSLNDIPWKWNVFGKKRNEHIGKIVQMLNTFFPFL
uniref:Uncharacterized protein n=1 Tax=Globodera rostochiensis TaxID=31243 RepID=A0A914IB94_GLORO